jgi:hypothetical protein
MLIQVQRRLIGHEGVRRRKEQRSLTLLTHLLRYWVPQLLVLSHSPQEVGIHVFELGCPISVSLL